VKLYFAPGVLYHVIVQKDRREPESQGQGLTLDLLSPSLEQSARQSRKAYGGIQEGVETN
jgi:hypothetical protein